LIFKQADFSTFSIDQAFTLPGYSVSYSNTIPINCTLVTKTYKKPCGDCAGEVHTGSYAFRLAGGGKKGTVFSLNKNTVSATEFKRKYKAMVWVHNSSPDQIELVMERKTTSSTSTQIINTSKATPYVKAGNWTLLRIEFDLSNANYQTHSVEVYLRNNHPSSFAIYDDFRVLPFHADMSNWVFEHQFNRVVSGLDADNFASFSQYDDRGRVMESAVELRNNPNLNILDGGKNTVQKFLYNDQKKN
jgi:hypothetical protein